MRPGLPELLVILSVVLILFGPGRLSKIGGELGSAISNFRRGVQEGAQTDEKKNDTTTNA